MNADIIDYLTKERVGVLAVEMPNGSPHGATVHFAYASESTTFYFQTFKDSHKAQSFIDGIARKATFVVGVDESTMKTIQLDGTVSLLTEEETNTCSEIYLGKFPEKTERSKDPKAVYFKFIPTWWRYSDFKRPEGKLILTSD